MQDRNEKLNNLAAEVLNLSRNTLVINLRFMDKAISMLKAVPNSSIPGIAVDGKTILYNPIYILKSYSEEKNKVTRQYLHMLLHSIYQHFWVGMLVNQDYWNLACDIAVECTINDLNLPAVKIAKEDEQIVEIEKLKRKVKYMTADVIYRYFLDTAPCYEEISRLAGIFSADSHDIWYFPKVLESKKAGGDGRGSNESGFDDESLDIPGVKENSASSSMKERAHEWEGVARQMKMDLETFSKEKAASSVLTQNLNALTREKYDYARFLKKFATTHEKMKVNDDEFDYIFYTYGLKFYDNMPLIEPLEYKEARGIKDFVIAIDTSGSTSGELVQKFLQKTYNILKGEENFFTKFNLHIIQCDDEIREDAKITCQAEFDKYIETMKIRGLGGTDFRPVFSYVDELVRDGEFTNLKGLIYFTDGYGTFPSKKPDYAAAVVYLNDGYDNPDVPSWAIKLVLTEEEIKESTL